MTKKMLASDNNSGIHPAILEAIAKANNGHAPAYGDDSWTSEATAKFKEQFGENAEVFFMFNGTGANVTGLKAMVRSHQAIICTEGAHIQVDEGGAAEGFIGGKLLTVPSSDGKLTISQIEQQLHHIGSQHRSQPKAISISQCTELGTVYTLNELKELCDFAHENDLYVHMDGARISNAAAYLDCSLKEMTVDVGIDMLSFGGTKNGLMIGEALVCFREELSADLKYIRKQGMQLGSKMRFVSAQFNRLLTNELWLENASHANQMAQLLADGMKKIPDITITQPVESNAVFDTLPQAQLQKLQKLHAFAVWNKQQGEIRLITSFDTTQEDIQLFLADLQTTFE